MKRKDLILVGQGRAIDLNYRMVIGPDRTFYESFEVTRQWNALDPEQYWIPVPNLRAKSGELNRNKVRESWGLVNNALLLHNDFPIDPYRDDIPEGISNKKIFFDKFGDIQTMIREHARMLSNHQTTQESINNDN